jgi:arsenate reductase (thioredoxin)
MPAGHYNILFLSNRNTARSIFAEAVANRLGQGHFKGFSAGTNPANFLDPLAIDVLRVAQYSVDGLRPKHWQEFARADAPALDFVFALCDPVAGEPLPHWSGRPITADWRYPDPANFPDEKWQRRKELARILAGLERQFRRSCSCRSSRSMKSVCRRDLANLVNETRSRAPPMLRTPRPCYDRLPCRDDRP